jgi:hypothetical protein
MLGGQTMRNLGELTGKKARRMGVIFEILGIILMPGFLFLWILSIIFRRLVYKKGEFFKK